MHTKCFELFDPFERIPIIIFMITRYIEGTKLRLQMPAMKVMNNEAENASSNESILENYKVHNCK